MAALPQCSPLLPTQFPSPQLELGQGPSTHPAAHGAGHTREARPAPAPHHLRKPRGAPACPGTPKPARTPSPAQRPPPHHPAAHTPPWVEQEPTAGEAGEQKEPLPGRSLCRHPNSTQGCQGRGGCSASSNRAPPSSLPYPSPGLTLPTQLQGLARPRPEPDTRFSRGWRRRRAERGSILTTTRCRSSAKAPPSPVPVRCRRGPSQPVPGGKSPHADRRGTHGSSLTSGASARTGRALRMSHIPKGCSPALT